MSLDNILQTTWGGNDDFRSRTKVELLFLDGTLDMRDMSHKLGLESMNVRTPPTMETQVKLRGVANFLVSDSIC